MSPSNSDPTTETSTGNGRGDADESVPPWPERGPDIAADADTDADAAEVDSTLDAGETEAAATETEATETETEPDTSEPVPDPEPIALPGPAPEADVVTVDDDVDMDMDVELDQRDPAEVETERLPPVVSELRPLLTDAGVWRERWTTVQTAFVDDPGLSIEQADRLVTEAVEDLAKTFHGHRATLQAQWRQGDPPADTEQLRLTLQGYRTLLFELLAQ